MVLASMEHVGTAKYQRPNLCSVANRLLDLHTFLKKKQNSCGQGDLLKVSRRLGKEN